MNFKRKIWVISALVAIAAGDASAQDQKPVYDSYTSKLEALQRLPNENMAWFIKAIESLFLLDNNNYKTGNLEAEKTYLSPKAISTYRDILKQWQLPEIPKQTLFTITGKIADEPKIKGLMEFSSTYIDGPYRVGGITIYEVELTTTLDNQLKSTHKLEISVGDLYGNGYIITEMKLIPE